MARNCYRDFLDIMEQAKRAHLKPYEEEVWLVTQVTRTRGRADLRPGVSRCPQPSARTGFFFGVSFVLQKALCL